MQIKPIFLILFCFFVGACSNGQEDQINADGKLTEKQAKSTVSDITEEVPDGKDALAPEIASPVLAPQPVAVPDPIPPVAVPPVVVPPLPPPPSLIPVPVVPVAECIDDDDCRDGQSCSDDFCESGFCAHRPVLGCAPCETTRDCADQDACTNDICENGHCVYTPVFGCASCNVDSDCPLPNACLTASCEESICEYATIEGCAACITNSDCNDGNSCTLDACNDGVCSRTPIAGCASCSIDTDCTDDNPCTEAACVPCEQEGCSGSGSICQFEPIIGCQPCDTAADCLNPPLCSLAGEGNATCAEGVCAYDTPVECPGSETCDEADGQCKCSDPGQTPIGSECTTDSDCVTCYCDPETDLCANIPVLTADMSILKVATPAVTTPGATVVFSLLVTNLGPDNAMNVLVTDTVPAGATITSVSLPGCSTVGQVVTCPLGTVTVGAIVNIEITVVIGDSSGELVNNSSVSSSTFDPNLINNEASATVVIIGPGLTNWLFSKFNVLKNELMIFANVERAAAKLMNAYLFAHI